MAEAILELDITPALEAIGVLSDEFDAATIGFGDGLADGLTQSIHAIGDGFFEVAQEFADSLAVAVADVAPGISATIGDSFAGIDIDTSGLDAAGSDVQDLSEGLDTLEASIGATSNASDYANLSFGGLQAASGLLEGSSKGLLTTLVPEAAIFAGVAVAVSGLIERGDKAELAVQRMNDVFGSSAPVVFDTRIRQAGMSLGELNSQAGGSNTSMRLAVATFGQAAQGLNFTQAEAAATAKQMGFLATTVTTLNPSLGTADQNFQLLTRGLGGSTRILQRYGISIDTTQRSIRALEIAHEHGRAKVELFDKQIAGGELALKALEKASGLAGSSLERDLAAKLDSPTIKFRAFKQEIASTLAEIGKPLVESGIKIVDALEPVFLRLVTLMGGVAKSVLDAVVPAAEWIGEHLTPVLNLLADALEEIEPLIGPIVTAFLAFKGIELVISGVGLAVTGLKAVTVGVAEALPNLLSGVATKIAGAGIAAQTAGETAAVGATGFNLLAGGLGWASFGFASLSSAVSGFIVPAAAFVATVAAIGFVVGAFDQTLASTGVTLDDVKAQKLPGLTAEFKAYEKALHGVAVQSLSWYEDQRTVDGELSLQEKAWAKLDRQQDIHIAKQRIASTTQDTFNKVLKEAPELAEKYIKAAAGAGLNTEHFTKQLNEQNAAIAKNALQQEARKKAVEAVAEAMVPLNALEVDAAKAMADWNAGTGAAVTVTKALSAAQNDLKMSMDLLLGNFISETQAENTFVKSMEELDGQLAENHNSFDVLFEDGRNNRDSLSKTAQSAETYSQAIFKATGSVTAAQVPLQQFAAHLGEVRAKIAEGGGDTKFIDDLLSQVNNTIVAMEQKKPEFQAAGAGAGNAYAAGVESTTPRSKEAGGKHGEASAEGAKEKHPKHKEAGQTTAQAYVDGFISKKPELIDAAGALANEGVAKLHEFDPSYEGAGNAAGLAVSGGLSQQDLADSATHLSDTAIAALSAEEIEYATQGAQYGVKVGEGFTKYDLASVSKSKLAETVALMGTTVGQWDQLGWDLMQGIASGMTKATPAVVTAAQAAMNQALARAQADNYVESPSKRWAKELGLPLIEGVAMGIAWGADAVALAATAAITNAMVLPAVAAPPFADGVTLASRAVEGQTLRTRPTLPEQAAPRAIAAVAGAGAGVTHDNSIHIDTVELHGETTDPRQHARALGDELRMAAFLQGR